MKQAYQAILIAPVEVMRERILSGEKSLTIREGHRDYRQGTVLLCCHLDIWCVMADITSVSWCKLNEITEEEMRADGFASFDQMLEGLQRFYKDITPESEVTIVRWANVRGELADDYRVRVECIKKVIGKMCVNNYETLIKWMRRENFDLKIWEHTKKCSGCAEVMNFSSFYTVMYCETFIKLVEERLKQ